MDLPRAASPAAVITAAGPPTSTTAGNNPPDFQIQTPPECFGIVECGLFRSNTFDSSSFPFLRSLQLKSMLLLSPEVPTREVSNWLDQNGVRLLHVGLLSRKQAGSSRPISEELIKDALEIALDIRHYPLMITCTLGVHETGTLVGCIRKLMNWSMNSIVVEYRAFAGSRARYINEQFIELFDLDLVTLPDAQFLS
eukprot:Partr_v1_DN26805_c1_g3_i1_m40331 putative PHOsphatase